jgi:D-alanyl-lipoteichoic acid acyltransferase DltB (MBOAT superfamily)
MELVSWQFLSLCGITLLVYYFLPRRSQNIWLLSASLAFCATFGWGVLAVLGGSILVNYLVGLRLAGSDKYRKAWLWAGLLANILALIFFRLAASHYLDRLLAVLMRSAGGQNLSVSVLLPVGFSFYTLQAISYLLDVYHRQIKACEDLVDFSLYMAYFPKLVSGPIERARSFLPRLAQTRVVDNETLASGVSLILLGLVRKILLVPLFSMAIPDGMFNAPGDFGRADLLFGLLAYAFWLYNDFAGYTSLVRGVSKLFGIDLTPNFQQPYFARNFNEFWNRWHISLSHWLRDYIFFPLSRALMRVSSNQRGLVNIILPPLVTMLVSGLWHNFGVYMLAWGGLHGLYQVAERMLQLWRPGPPPNQQPVWRQVLSAVRVFLLTVLAWSAFASGGLSKTLSFWKEVFSSGVESRFSLSYSALPLLGLLFCLILDWAQYKGKDDLVFLHWPRLTQAALLALLMAAFAFTVLWGNLSFTSFVYQGF